MRSIHADLTAEQKKYNVTPVVTIEFDSTDLSDYLIGYEYRERANQISFTDIYLDNTSEYFNDNPPALGDEVIITRGLNCSGTDRTDDLPSVYVEELEYSHGMLKVVCIDFWGKLMHYRRHVTTVWTGEDVEDMIDYILDQVGLTYSGSITSLNLDFQITRNTRFDQALRRVCSKIPEYPYAGTGEVVKFKDLDSADNRDYSFGWNSDHPVKEMSYTETAWKYNKITVIGSLDSAGDEYSGYAEDLTQRGLVGLRELIIKDPSLVSDQQCEDKAGAELSYYEAAATQIELEALPCHGLELYDVVGLHTTNWGDDAFQARVKSYIERYGPGLHQQEIQLLSPESDIHVETAGMPDWLIEDDTDSSGKIGPEALSVFHTLGAIVRGTDAEANYDTAAKVAAEFLTSAGRVASVGDAILLWNANSSTWRLYIYEATDPEWVYITIGGSVT